jgi:hypothetical protein
MTVAEDKHSRGISTANAQTAQSPDLGAAWTKFTDDLQALGPWLVSQQGVPQGEKLIESDGYRYLASLLYAGLDIHVLDGDPDRPQWSPSFTCYARYGGDTPDGVYHGAPVDPNGTYRIIGKAQGGLPITANIQTMSGWWQPGMPNKTVKTQDILNLNLDPDGNFELIVGGPQRKRNYLSLDPSITHLMARQYISDDRKQKLYKLSIDRIDQPLSIPRTSEDPAALAKKLDNAVGFVKEMSSAFLNTMRFSLSAKNALKPLPEAAKAALGANAQNSYYGGSWDLNDNQALLIEVTPTKAAYWSIVAQNVWMQGLAHESIPAFINMDTAVLDTDGKIRVIVSAKDPGYANWICTGGMRIGLFAVRWNQKEGEERMEAKLVNFDEISQAMPGNSAKVTPEDRQQLLQALRSHILRRYGR